MTTIARAAESLLRQLGEPCCVLDGDELRQGLSSDLGLSRKDRGEQARRVAHLAVLLATSGITPLCALVSPYADDRERARRLHEARGIGFTEVWVDTPLTICSERDTKGLYRRNGVASSELRGSVSDGSGLTGVNAPYEVPASPEIVVRGYDESPHSAAAKIVSVIFPTLAGALTNASATPRTEFTVPALTSQS